MAVAELQKEVEELLRKLTLEEITNVANHLQVGVEENDTERQIMRKIEDAFDAEGDDAAREELLRNLPMPEAKQDDYDHLLNPAENQENENNNRAIEGVANDQVVPDNNGDVNGGEQNIGVPLPANNGGVIAQQNLGGFPQQNPVGQFGNGANVLGVARQQNLRFGGVPQGVAAGTAHIFGMPNPVRHAAQNVNAGGPNPNLFVEQPLNVANGHVPNLNLMNGPQQQRLVQFFPREFRMTGSITDDISKSMKYLDICRQVADGRNKGYRDEEILSGLRRAVATGAVKTVIDSQTNASLEEILLFLRSFLKERTPAELHNDLSQMSQKESQTAISFFMEALQTRQLIVVGSQVEGTVSYDPALVKSTFLHTIRTGLRDETVRAHMLPLLSDANPVDDNTLIRELHRAVGEAEERLKKLQESHHQKKSSAKVNVVETSPELAMIMKKLEESQAQMMENKNQMKVMQEQMAEIMKKETGGKAPFWRPGCDACKANNQSSSCRHCWKCGEDEHKAQEKDKCKKGK